MKQLNVVYPSQSSVYSLINKLILENSSIHRQEGKFFYVEDFSIYNHHLNNL